MDAYYKAIRLLPSWLARPLASLPMQTVRGVQEIRLRTGCSLCLTLNGRQQPLPALPECPPPLRELRLTPLQMEEIFLTLCGGSVHTHQEELTQGYLSTPLGCRVGVAGRYAARDGQKPVLQMVTSLNLRIARQAAIPVPEAVLNRLRGRFIGMLVVGEPGSGKTTVLRQLAEWLAAQHQAVTVVDERGELFPPEREAALPDLDCIAGLAKGAAVQMALRTLAPRVILLDELGGLEEAAALEQGFFGGVDFIASLHAANATEALRRPQVQYLVQHAMLHVMVLLSGREHPGHVQEVRML